MPSSRETEAADLFRVDAEFRSTGTNETDAALCVLPRGKMLGCVLGTSDPVSHDDGRHAFLVEVLRDSDSFVLIAAFPVRAAGKNDDAGAALLFRRNAELVSWDGLVILEIRNFTVRPNRYLLAGTE